MFSKSILKQALFGFMWGCTLSLALINGWLIGSKGWERHQYNMAPDYLRSTRDGKANIRFVVRSHNPSWEETVKAEFIKAATSLYQCDYLHSQKQGVVRFIMKRLNSADGITITTYAHQLNTKDGMRCGEAYLYGTEITLFEEGFVRGYCTSLRRTLAHELLHIGGMNHDTPEATEEFNVTMTACGYNVPN